MKEVSKMTEQELDELIAKHQQHPYSTFTTFMSDFQIANKFAIQSKDTSPIEDTFKRGMEFAKTDVRYFVEFSLAINLFCWDFYYKSNKCAKDGDKDLEEIYDKLSNYYGDLNYKCLDVAYDTFKDETEREYYYRMTD